MIDQSKIAPLNTRDRIIETAQQLFFEQGYASTGVAQIRKASGANSGSLYHFLSSKEDLLVAVLEKYKETLNSQVLEPAYEQTSDPTQRVFAILEVAKYSGRRTFAWGARSGVWRWKFPTPIQMSNARSSRTSKCCSRRFRD